MIYRVPGEIGLGYLSKTEKRKVTSIESRDFDFWDYDKKS